LWVTMCVFGGFYFGNVTFVKEHFSLVAIGIVIISLLPMVIAAIKTRTAKATER
ncbi:cytochrome O ubiquinol oxidase, partial [Lacticaseibacillus paracasei]